MIEDVCYIIAESMTHMQEWIKGVRDWTGDGGVAWC
jgi:hypothetical protein